MMDERDEALDFLARLGAQPAVAFHEDGAAAAARAILDATGIEHRTDAYGNILARLPGGGSDGGAPTPPLAIVAHLDHPGFELTGRNGDGDFVAEALGGIPPSAFDAGTPLQIMLPGGRRIAASTIGPYGEPSARQALVRLSGAAAADEDLPLPAAAVFDLPDFVMDGDYIHMRAADDLAGCAAALAALARLSRRADRPPGDVYALLTRAEEVGLVGARLAAESRLLPPDTLLISVESSRALPGAEPGLGAVIRVGDAGSTFDADAESVLIRAREALQEGDRGFRAQRQLMSGGVCEASAFAAYGYRATGLAFPLGNYHNGAPDGGIEAEYIHIDDFLSGAALLTEAAHRVADRANTAFRRRLQAVPEELARRLQRTRPPGD